MLFGSRAFKKGESRKSMSLPLLIWVLASMSVLVFYFASYHSVQKDLIGNFLKYCLRVSLFDLMQTFFVSLANPLCLEPYTATGVGLAIFLILVFIVVNLIRGRWRITSESIAPLALLLFGLLSTAMIFIGRAPDGGISALLTSRYVSITCLGTVGLLLFVSTIESTIEVPRLEINASIAAALGCLMFVATISCDLFGLPKGEEVRAARLTAVKILKNYRVESDDRLKLLMPFPKVLRAYAPYLEQEKYSVFRRP
jgi:flagellar biosynthesis protein FlhB